MKRTQGIIGSARWRRDDKRFVAWAAGGVVVASLVFVAIQQGRPSAGCSGAEPDRVGIERPDFPGRFATAPGCAVPPASGNTDSSIESLRTEAANKGKVISTIERGRRIEPLTGASRIMREKLVETDGKYSLKAVEEEVESPAGAAAGEERAVSRVEMVADHVIVRLKPGMREGDLAALAAKQGGHIRRKLRGPQGTYLVAIPEPGATQVRKAAAAFRLLADVVAGAGPDFIVHALGIPDDPKFHHLWGMHNTGQVTTGYTTGGTPDADIDAPEAWDLCTGNHDVRVGVIDTGIDYTHPDLESNIWANPGETGVDGLGRDKRSNGQDDDGNGFIDDWHGWDFCNDDNDPMDDHYHGTHCAGTIGGIGNNAVGVAGVCWQVSLVGLKFLSSGGSGTMSDAMEAVYYATALGLDLTSNSWGGGGHSDEFREALLDADAHGLLFVAAAGNDGADNDVNPLYPASYDCSNVIAVAAIDHSDALAGFSCYGRTSVDLGAPGVYIGSACPLKYAAAEGFADNPYIAISGTSMATPHVAGACALVKAYVPQLTHREIKETILEAADPLKVLAGKCVTGGRLNVYHALQGISPAPAFRVEAVVADDGPGGNGDGVINPGETVALTVSVFNYGYQGTAGVGGTLSTTNADILVTDSSAAYGDVAARTTAASVFRFTVAANCLTPRTVNLTLTLRDAGSREWVLPIALRVSLSYSMSGSATLDGAGVQGVAVEYVGEFYSGAVETGPDGAFGVAVGEGTYTIQARYGQSPTARYAPVKVNVPPGTNNLKLAFQTAAVSGTVRDWDRGTPVDGAAVTYEGPVSGVVTTDQAGGYSFTYVYAQEACYAVSASKPAFYPYPPNVQEVTVPPEAMGTDFWLGAPRLDAMPDAFVVTLAPGGMAERHLTITNAGAMRLDWSSATMVNTNSAAGAVVTNFATPSDVFSGITPWPESSLCDGQYLYTAKSGKLYKQRLPDGALVETVDLAANLPDYQTGWRASFVDGEYMWFCHAESVKDETLGTVQRPVMNAVDTNHWVVARTLQFDPWLCFSSMNAPSRWFDVARIALGGNGVWFYAADTDRLTGTVRMYLVKTNRSNGSIEKKVPVPAGCGSRTGLMGVAYSGGALWMWRNQTASASTVLYKIDPDTGDLLATVQTSVGGITLASADGRGVLWCWCKRYPWDGYQWIAGLDTGERLWVTTAPALGSVGGPSRGVARVTAFFEANAACAGSNFGGIRLDSNDPDRPSLYVPVVLNVVTNGGGNTAPIVLSAMPQSPVGLKEMESHAFSFAASDADGDPLAYRWTLDGRLLPNVTGTNWTLTTGYADAGSRTVCATVLDGRGGAAQQVWHVTVTNINRSPVAYDQALDTLDSEPLSLVLTASDPDSEALSYTVVSGPAHGTIEGTPPCLTYTPNTGYRGEDSIGFRASDGEDISNVGTITVTVGYGDMAVSASSFAITAPYGTVATQSFTLANSGNLPLRWYSPMVSRTPVLGSGRTLREISGLPAPDTSSPNHRGLAFDGTNLWVGNSIYVPASYGSIYVRDDLIKVDPVTGALLQKATPSPAGGVAFLAWDGRRLSSLSKDSVSASKYRAYDIQGSTAVVQEEFLMWGDQWEAGDLNGLTVVDGIPLICWAGSLYRIDPTTGNKALWLKVADPGYGGAVAYWNGAIWEADWAFYSPVVRKIHPLTGETLLVMPNVMALDFLDMTPDEQGNFFVLQASSNWNVALIASGDYLLMNPYGGSLAGGRSTNVTVRFDTVAGGPGEHVATIHVLSNDPDEPDIEIPVTFTVTPAQGDSVPVIANASPATPFTIPARELTVYSVEATDADGDTLTYRWTLDGEHVKCATGAQFDWLARASQAGAHTVAVMVNDGRGGTAAHEWAVNVVAELLSVSLAVNPPFGPAALAADFHADLRGGPDYTNGPFQEMDGIVVMEAEHCTAMNPGMNWEWKEFKTSTYQPMGEGYVYVLGHTIYGPTYWNDRVELSYDVQFETPGTYYVWMRAMAGNVGDDSAWVGLDGRQIGGVFDDSGVCLEWRWVRHEVPFAVSAGLHTFNLRARDDDYMIDRILLTTNSACAPQATGPIWESPRLPGCEFLWSFGDGTGEPGDARMAHTYTGSGVYVATITVTDDDGGMATGSVSVVAYASGPNDLNVQVQGLERRFAVLGFAADGGTNAAAAVENDGHTLRLTGNGWRRIALPYAVTSNTLVAFDFRSGIQGEMHGIGLDVGETPQAACTFQLYGTASWGVGEYRTYGAVAPATKTFALRPGRFFQGGTIYLTFAAVEAGGGRGERVLQYPDLRVLVGDCPVCGGGPRAHVAEHAD